MGFWLKLMRMQNKKNNKTEFYFSVKYCVDSHYVFASTNAL